ncbi:hypothetical protein [Mycobacterium decipiens]|nr:hypothetical protein [Mycobacterium decipiens]
MVLVSLERCGIVLKPPLELMFAIHDWIGQCRVRFDDLTSMRVTYRML